ncbi:MAG: NAD-dependent epimerase/dehydratase family protein [Lachnospiraceae bacterium]|nr:NAD-dependent epimerase/dehydratase family protein [Lachnospiraceae bacterium]
MLTDYRLYKEDVAYTAALELPWEKLQDQVFMISGASGLLASFLIDVLMEKNRTEQLNCRLIALVRDEEKAKKRFAAYLEDPCFSIHACDINRRETLPEEKQVDYILHAASNTHPVAYATDPIGTVTTNIIGTDNLLNFAAEHGCRRFAFASSNEIYGENRGDAELFDEKYCGYIDSNTMRAGYPESKRCGEALCQAYIRQKGLDCVIPRFTRSYGPSMLMSDTKAISQFIRKGIAGEDIVLKSAGTQYYSYTYVSDAVAGFLTVLLKGECGEAYNIADVRSDIMLKDLAAEIAEIAGKQVIFEIPDAVEQAGYSTATKARLDGTKLQKLGWNARYSMREGLERTITTLREMAE